MSLYANINKRKKAGTSRTKKKSTISKKAFANMKKGMPRVQASKIGIGEIAWPVISSTATTLMAFLPFALWPGTMGKFMIYFPITLTVTLTASLFVAMVVNAAMTGGSMDTEDKNVTLKSAKNYTILLGIIGIVFVATFFINWN